MSLKKSTLLLFFLKELLEGKKISLKSFALENDINISVKRSAKLGS